MKVMDLDGFKLYVFSNIPLSYNLTEVLSYVLVAVEFSVGIQFLTLRTSRISFWIAAALLSFFSAFLVWRIILGDTGNCHCFGSRLKMDPLTSLIKNGILALLLFVVWHHKKYAGSGAALVGSCAMIVALIASSIVCKPDFICASKHQAPEMNENELIGLLEEYGLDSGTHEVVFLSTGCRYCQMFMSKLHSLVKHGVVDSGRLFFFFSGFGDISDSVNDFFNNYSEWILYPSVTLDPVRFLSITNGSMPVAVTAVEGQIVSKYDLILLTESKFK